VRPPTDTTKSRAGKRIIPLPGAIVDLLLAHIESQSTERQKAGQLWSEEGWILQTRLIVEGVRAAVGDAHYRVLPELAALRASRGHHDDGIPMSRNVLAS
jgi:integrase